MMRSFRGREILLLAGALTLAGIGCGEGAPGPRAATARSEALTQGEVLPTGGVCTPTGAHGKHGAVTSCSTCHVCGGVLAFDPNGPAVSAANPSPTFDATAKTCSSVACHGVPPGTFSYYFGDDGMGGAVYNTVTYGSTASITPAWYTTGATTCTGCHGNPPRNGSSGSNVWHSGYHAGQDPTGPANQCQFCHPDAVSTNGVATGLNTGTCYVNGAYVPCASLHANGTVNVTARFTSSCLGCH